MGAYRLTQSSRLKQSQQFEFLRKRGRRIPSRSVLVEYFFNATDAPAQLGITVSRRYGNAVKRNRFKRVVREAFRTHQHLLPHGLLLNIKPLAHSTLPSPQMLGEELVCLFRNGLSR